MTSNKEKAEKILIDMEKQLELSIEEAAKIAINELKIVDGYTYTYMPKSKFEAVKLQFDGHDRIETGDFLVPFTFAQLNEIDEKQAEKNKLIEKLCKEMGNQIEANEGRPTTFADEFFEEAGAISYIKDVKVKMLEKGYAEWQVTTNYSMVLGEKYSLEEYVEKMVDNRIQELEEKIKEHKRSLNPPIQNKQARKKTKTGFLAKFVALFS